MLKLSNGCSSKTDTKILLDAISNDKIHLARFILDALDGKIVDSRSEGAQTPLISAVFLQDSCARCKFMNLLLQRGANVNRPDESGRTALSYACEMGYLDAVKILVKNSADPEAADRWGNTALMYAVVAGHSDIVEFLVRAFKRLGLQVDRQNKVGNSAVEVAKHLGHTDCLQALVSNTKRIHDGDALAEHLSRVNISGAENTEIREVDGTCLTRKRSQSLRNRIQSMDSIKEYERESDASLPLSAQGLSLTSVLTPKPPQKLSGDHQPSCSTNHLPPLFYSPSPLRSGTQPSSSSGPLRILLTPFGKSAKEEPEKAKKLPFDLPIRRFDDSYYQKRCSLPTSVLVPAAPERRKAKTVVKPSENAAQPSTSLSTLGGRLLRRFTFPEFKRSGKESQEGCGAQSRGSDPSGRSIPKSESFPLGKNHPQVGSKPSIDSISAVKCEFDFQLKAAPDV